MQKEQAWQVYEAALDIRIAAERDDFLAALIAKQETETLTDARRDLRSAERDEYEANYQANVNASLAEYQAALSAIAADAEAFQQELAVAEAEFQQNLNRIEAFEDAVRTNVTNAVDALDQQLQNSGFFYVQNCDAQNVCTATGTLTAAGTALQTLIADMRDGLANDADLSALGQQLSAYLAGRETHAVTTRNDWQARVTTARNIWTDDGGMGRAGLTAAFDYSIYSGTIIEAMIQEFMNPGSNALASFLNSGHRTAQNFSGLDLCGSSTLHWPYPVTGLTSNTNECWHGSGAGAGAFAYNAQGCGGPPLVCVWNPLAPNGHPEARIDAVGTYELYDPNADNNANVWSQYVNNIQLERNMWDVDLIPALQ
ncbi:MAG TPA: TIGR04388 family protein, partial [candidate division Zixibacteria bacterium]|nr:TIGR04388 family protein [candidate division Zixibacteria bacterium]